MFGHVLKDRLFFFLIIEKGFYGSLEFVYCYLGGAMQVKDLETRNSERHKAIESAKLY